MINLSNSVIKKSNKLIEEKSPYLLQHAHNPVDWYPWGKEAFEKAKEEDKPIFLSIGYSTCHWCHVMERESFEDPEVAELMNDVFVSIKVDREERLDIDKIYMDVCQAMTGSGGWPLTIIMTPDKRPFFAATYISKKGRFGRSGMLELIPAIQEHWSTKRKEVIKSADEIFQAITKRSNTNEGEELGKDSLAKAYSQLVQRFDEKDGGFGDQPKFPTPHNIFFLLRYWKRTGSVQALHMAEKTLQAMRFGGIYDQIGFGFHRYSTDFFWLVPHFEKMLYDQALLSLAYSEAYHATKKELYKTTTMEILTYVLRDMTSPLGGFYSAEDADSRNEAGEMEEGNFYLWKEEELRRVLKPEDAELILKIFNIKRGGNFLDQLTQRRTGENILYLKKPLDTLAQEFNLTKQELYMRIEEIRFKLFTIRESRPHPHKDDKILTNWNGLMIASLAKASSIFDDPKFSEAAQSAIEFIYNQLFQDGKLLHRFRDGEAAILANVEDHAFLIWGLLEQYETTFDTNYLRKALYLNTYMINRFWDETNGGFYFTPDDGEELLYRKKEIYDGAVPSGNSVAMLNLLRLEQITGNSDYGRKAARISSVFSKEVKRMPSGFTQLMVALEFALGTSYQIIVAGDSRSEDTKSMVKAVRNQYIPNLVFLLNPTERVSPEIFQISEFIKEQPNIGGKATAYVCVNGFCKNPVTSIEDIIRIINQSQNKIPL